METSRNGDRDVAQVLGARIDRLDMTGTLERCVKAIESREYTQHMAVNAAKLVSMTKDPELRRIVNDCGIVNADGQAVVWASKVLGDPLPERVAGVDLMHELIAQAEDRGHRPFILGATGESLDRAVDELRRRHPRLQLAGYRDGYFSQDEQPTVAEEIRATGADILFVAISSPTKEYFLAEYGEKMGVPLVMGVGGSVDIISGVTRRAPRVWQKLGLEWLYRLLQEPRRMFKRYAVTNTVFLTLVLRTLFRRGRS
jgi:N-acetylglucosaminyldiphosphoundecaprenol N-acetyl-beta-D-mannosaminyltransferase